ncbi:hypothetical protein KO561_12490 [Radiobacillus kanasensis]|uniref:hypothetical protein n=1 Tax=Radiobacillus kanasensis TaxID=2844358 RepID=UPI001E59FAB8|nr:hypothetical protein [Radiobacillus kanasensis]UFT98020.1 hypothetical protein KO561_12490 [Radiobacillus kanasensis]
MFIIQTRRLIDEQMNRLTNGYSAYVETNELTRLMQREITKRNLPVILDQTESGCWFIPEKSAQTY